MKSFITPAKICSGEKLSSELSLICNMALYKYKFIVHGPALKMRLILIHKICFDHNYYIFECTIIISLGK